MVEVGHHSSDLLKKLGLPAEVLSSRLGEIAKKTGLAKLRLLRESIGDEAVDANKFGRALMDGRANIPPFCYNPSPNEARSNLAPFVSQTYFQHEGPEQHDANNPFPGLFDPRRRKATMLTMLLQDDPNVRKSFEKVAGGQVVPDGRVDGRVNMVDASAMTGVSTQALSYAPVQDDKRTPYELFMLLDQAIQEQARALVPGTANASEGGILELEVGVGSILDSSGNSPSGNFNYSSGDDDSFGGSLASNSLSASPTAQNGVRDLLEPTTQGNTDSVDTGALRLKRLMDKRDQMYDLYRQVNDKYNQSAQKAIDNMRG